jgi:hypothetical protein
VEGFHKHGNKPSGIIKFSSLVAEQLAASQEGLSFMKLLTLLSKLSRHW